MQFATNSFRVVASRDTSTPAKRLLAATWLNYMQHRLSLGRLLLSLFAEQRIEMTALFPAVISFSAKCSCGKTHTRDSVIYPKFSLSHGFLYGLHNHYCDCGAILLSITFQEEDCQLFPVLTGGECASDFQIAFADYMSSQK